MSWCHVEFFLVINFILLKYILVYDLFSEVRLFLGEATGNFEEEDLEHGWSSLKVVHKLIEEEAVAIILPDYVPDSVHSHSL